MSPESIIKILETIADDVVPVSNAKIAAAIVYRGDIIAIGINKLKSDPLQARFAKNQHAIYLHAEIDAIKKALKRLTSAEMKKAELYIVRRRKLDGKPASGCSKPCCGCQRAIETYGISEVHYST